jgi:hypothetical protein
MFPFGGVDPAQRDPEGLFFQGCGEICLEALRSAAPQNHLHLAA